MGILGRESKVQKRIKRQLDKSNWMVMKLGIVSVSGFPDLIALKKPGKIVFIEVKARGKKPRKLQEYWLKRLRFMGFDARYCDSADQIEDLL